MAPKKRKEWLYNFAHSLEQISNERVKQAYQQEFTFQPYAGNFLFFLLFEDHSEN
jgi:hypothetical protein